ncbi:protein IWS1 homolog isoform X2 [Scyliorhinus canicula]|uniref:protein IWS1 homolog isoform X2 n=1 Tax=Scyliorhinus canicula TaxID=7830 RepID=UPI0018F3D83A|nr:protein IWS1 homolog isoform X2 [Scyliorhinus canicula]
MVRLTSIGLTKGSNRQSRPRGLRAARPLTRGHAQCCPRCRPRRRLHLAKRSREEGVRCRGGAGVGCSFTLSPWIWRANITRTEKDESHKEDQSDAEGNDIPGRPQSREDHHVSSDSESEEPKKALSIKQSDDEAGSDKENHSINEDSSGEQERSHDRMNDTDSEKDVRISPEHNESQEANDDDGPVPHRASNSDDEQDEEEREETVKRKKPILSDSEDEKEEINKSAKQCRVMSDSEDSGSDFSPKKKKSSASGGEKSDSDSDLKKKQLASAGEDSDSDADVATAKRIVSDDDNSDDDVDLSKAKRVVSDVDDSDSDSNTRVKKQVVSDAEDSDSNTDVRKKRVFSNDDDSESDTAPKKKRVVSEDEDSNSDSDAPAKKRRVLSAGEDSDSDAEPEKQESNGVLSDSDEDEENKEPSQKAEPGLFGSDSDSEDEAGVGNLIADIFGESDDEGEEFTGFNQEDLDGEKAALETERKKLVAEESDSDNEVRGKGRDSDFVSDFEVMLQKKKDLNRKRRRNRDGGTFISDADDVVSAMITKMNEAAEEDRQLNGQKKPALKKLTLLPTVVMHLKKQDLKDTFIDSGVMSAIKEWLTPLPDKSLPHLKIREELLKILQELPSVSQETLKHSGIGRCVMYLYKHPKENRFNKELAGKLINEWSRPIFGLTSNYKGMTREEREQRDIDQMPMRRRLSSSGGQTPRRDLEKVLTGEEKALRPGDPGFCTRARVPLPSNRDYVVRPKWNVEIETGRGSVKKTFNRLDKQMRRFQDIKKMTKSSRAVKISIEGNRMPL